MLRGMRCNNTGQVKTVRQMPQKPILFLITTVLIYLLFTGISHAATSYVSPTGAATWANCSGTTPLNGASACSCQTAMANAVAGDIVYFRGGTYDLGVFDNHPSISYTKMYPLNSGTAGNPITFIAYPAETPILTGTVTTTSQEAWFGCGNETVNRNYITWDGFSVTAQFNLNPDPHYENAIFRAAGDYCILRNSRFTGVDVGLWPYNTSFVRVETASYATIENNYFRDLVSVSYNEPNTAAVWIIGIHSLEDHITIRNNTMENMEGGVYGKGNPTNVEVYNNFIYNSSNTCLNGVYFNKQLDGGITPAIHRVYQNIIVGCNTAISSTPLVSATGFLFYNNTIYSSNNSFDGIYLGGALTSAEVFNNIIANLSPLLRYYDGVVSYSNYNNFYRAAGNVWNRNYATDYTSLSAWTAATGFDANSITSNPLFVNAGGANPTDYKLQANSPARTSGRGGSYATVMGAYITGNETIGYDPDAPRVEITSPASSTVTTTNTSITISGTATDTVGIVNVTWSNDRGGSGGCSGTENWICSNIPLQSGQNIITVIATDGDNKTGTDTLIINPTKLSSSGSEGNGGGNSTSGGSGCGIIKKPNDKSTGSGLKAIDIGIASLLLLMLFYKLRKLYKINFWMVFVFFIITITIVSNVEAATLEVGAGKTYSTIQAAANAANAGDTILVFPGTYNERVTFPLGKTGTAGNKIIFKSQTSRAAFMNGFDTGNANYLRIEGFDISYNAGGWYGGGIWINNSSYVEIVDNYFHDIPGQAINPNWSSGVTHNNIYVANNKIYRVNQGIIARGNDWLVENNDIERLVGAYYDADYTRFFGENITFRNNYFHGTSQNKIGTSHTDGFQTFAVNPGEYAKNIIIEGNVVRDFYHQGLMLEGKAGTHDNLIVRNNIFADAASWGIAAHGIANLQVLNNNFINMLIHGVGFRAANDGTPTTGVVQNNIFYNGGTNYWKETTCIGCTLTGGYNIITIEKYPYYKESTDLIGVDPLFVNAIGYDFHLQSGSLAIDAGTSSVAAVVTADIEGNTRPIGAGYDIGAYEMADPNAPSVQITSPTTGNTYPSSGAFSGDLALSGTATPASGRSISSVSCSNGNGGSCVCSGTTNWTCNTSISSGQTNINITVKAIDNNNSSGIDVLVVNPSSGGGNGGDTGGNTGGGGDSSASGGSGCGFVKDINVKGHRAKGEGVALMLMLIIALTVVFVLRRATKINQI